MPQIYKIFILFLFATSAWLSTVTPPFQSPDEFEHITRAYLLGRGEFVLDAPSGQSSGGEIDRGLNEYMNRYSSLPFNPERKLNQTEIYSAKQILWTKTSEFRPSAGSAYYFPAIYAVHTVGLFIGRTLDLTIDASYRLTRLILLLSICTVLYFSFLLYRPPIFTLSLLVLPMSLFQFSSASLDGIATALSIFVISVFMRIKTDREKSNSYLFPLMLLAWVVLVSSRLQLFPMILLVIMAILYLRKTILMIFVMLSTTFVIGWQIVVMKTIVDGRVKLGASSGEIISYYLQHPIQLVNVFFATLTDTEHLRGYFSSFFGLLGWLDTPFPGREYVYLLMLSSLIFIISLKFPFKSEERQTAIVFLTVSFGVIAIVFFAMLVTWTPHPANFIEGVQGRYFLIPAILVTYAVNSNFEVSGFYRGIVSLTLLLVLGVYSFVITDFLLLGRYYML